MAFILTSLSLDTPIPIPQQLRVNTEILAIWSLKHAYQYHIKHLRHGTFITLGINSFETMYFSIREDHREDIIISSLNWMKSGHKLHII